MKTFATRARAIPVVFAVGLLIGGTSGVAIAYQQQHMYNALHDLQTAQTELNLANADKGGHRIKALDYVQSAIDEVNLGITAAGGK